MDGLTAVLNVLTFLLVHPLVIYDSEFAKERMFIMGLGYFLVGIAIILKSLFI